MGKVKDILGNALSLSCDAVDVQSRDIDWREALGEDMEGWRAFESFECDECGREAVMSSLGEDEHRYIEPEVDDDEGGMVDNECMGYLCFEGPAMNYWYPVKIDDCEAAAAKITHLPLCVVEFKDGQTGLALTGGGMDLSWEICEAFIELGYYPPVHFCDLPDMAGMQWNGRTERIVAACKESARIQSGWAEGKISRLENLENSLKKGAA